jgi:hypothetical protein
MGRDSLCGRLAGAQNSRRWHRASSLLAAAAPCGEQLRRLSQAVNLKALSTCWYEGVNLTVWAGSASQFLGI